MTTTVLASKTHSLVQSRAFLLQMLLRTLLLLAFSLGTVAAQYTVQLTEHRSMPLVSKANKPGHGHSPCK